MSGGYSALAGSYDLLTDNVGYEALADYVSSLLAENGVEDGCVLDLACGTGRLTALLAKKGYDMIGTDISGDMLSLAMNNAFDAGVNILFLCQSMQNLDLYGTVDAAVCTLDSINHLTDSADVLRTFKRVSLFLNPGGVFVFDVNTVFKHREILADNTFVYDLDEVFCVWQNTYNKSSNIVDIELNIFEKDGRAYRRRTEAFSERAYEPEELKELLGKAGLETRAVYGEMTRQQPPGDCQRLVFVAVKK